MTLFTSGWMAFCKRLHLYTFNLEGDQTFGWALAHEGPQGDDISAHIVDGLGQAGQFCRAYPAC